MNIDTLMRDQTVVMGPSGNVQYDELGFWFEES